MSRLAEITEIANALRKYTLRHSADPHLAGIAVLTPRGRLGFMLSLDMDIVNTRTRWLDPIVRVFQQKNEGGTVYVLRKYPISSVALHALDEASRKALREAARIPSPDEKLKYKDLRDGV